MNDQISQIMDRQKTCEYIINRKLSHKRIVISRYNDGEYLIMKGQPPVLLFPNMGKHVGELLLSAIKMPNQLVCINNLKPHNTKNRDVYFSAHNFFLENSQHALYGDTQYNVHDFTHTGETLACLFSEKTLLVGGYADQMASEFAGVNPKIDYYVTAKVRADDYFEEYLSVLQKKISFYDNVLFFCGPIGKVLIAHLAQNSSANLIDIGCVPLAILEGITNKKLTREWHMTWSEQFDLKNLSQQIKSKIVRG